ncbi:MAG: hypothetical protein RL289_1368 [Actinomycetota bacterium]|jgi:uncharacterized protein (TIGR03089 family)
MSFWTDLQRNTSARGAAPLVTWLSDIGRIELSGLTFNNAICKASNFLVDGLELEEDATVSVSLGNHWQSPVWFGTALATGLTITDQEPAITFGIKSQAQTWQGSPEEFVIVSQDPFGMPDKEVPGGFINGSADVRNFGDYFSPAWPVTADHLAVDFESTELTWDQLVARALELAEQHALKSGISYGLFGTSDLVILAALQVVLPVVNENSVVLIDQANPDFDAIKKQEKLEQIVLLG